MRLGDLTLLISLAAIWGASFLFMRISAPDFGPIPLVAFRMGVGGLALSMIFFKKEARLVAKNHWWQLLVSGVFGSALSFILLSYATLTLSAGLTSLMNSSVPVFSAVIAAIWLGERLTRFQILGIFLGMIGVSILVWGKLDFGKAGMGWPLLACLVSCACYGFGANWMKSRLSGVRPLVASAGSLLGAGIVLVPFALSRIPEVNPSAVSWGSAISLALICTGLAFVLFFRLLQRSGTTVATSVTFLIPFFGVFWGWLFLDEIVSARMMIGLLVTLAGTALITQMFPGIRKW